MTARFEFFAADVLRASGVRAYQLRTHEGIVLVRHDNVEDSFVLKEIFGAIDTYRVPPGVLQALRERGVSSVTDLGANIGLSALKFGRMFPEARLTCVEPDAANAMILEATLALNGLLRRAEVLRVAAATQPGRLRFAGGQGGRSRAAAPGEEAVEVDAIDIFPVLERTDLLKVDIEGGEWALLADERLGTTPVAAICMEYHAYLCPDGDPTHAVTMLLGRAGYKIMSLREEPPGGVLWAMRP